MPKPDVDDSKAVEPAPKKARTHLKKQEESRAPRAKSRARSTKPKSKEFISDDEHNEVPADKVIFVKSKTTAVPSTQPAIPVAKFKDTKPADSASEDDALDEDTSSVCLFSVQCQRCIKDDVPCAVVLSKKIGKIRKCYRHCNEKKMKTLSPLVDKSINEDAEGEDITKPATPTPNVDNDVNMDFDTQKAMPNLLGDAPANPAVQQPSNLDIIQMIQAMHQEFIGMLQNSGDRSEALNQMINTRVNDLAHNWEERFATMEKKMWEVKLHMAGNMVSIGHMANAMKAFITSGDISAFQPTPGHLFGQIPPSWIPQLPPPADDGHPLDPSASEVGKLFTTAWDVSRGPVPVLQGKALHPHLSPPAIPLASVQAHNCQASLLAVPLSKIS
ncbi:hypothetical protein F4604DRAFT_1691286 [Suillus subluteus]|nr:hypothetical protein F4604DRAFT_1691286 [Suillus subluteus]